MTSTAGTRSARGARPGRERRLRAARLSARLAGDDLAGSRTVNVEPLPMLAVDRRSSPPIIWQKRRLMASPSPVPPYLRVVEASACENGWKSFSICCGASCRCRCR